MLALDRWVVDRAAQLQERIQKAYDEYRFLDVYQQLLTFCSSDLGGFYLDIIKDRQYTTQEDSLARRSCQTALFKILSALTRWISPILSFTADELYELLPGEHLDSVHLEMYAEDLPCLPKDDAFGRAFWEEVMSVKHAVNKCLEDARNQGLVKGSLDTEVTLFANDALLATLGRLEDELRFVMLTSDATLKPLAEATDATDTEIDGLKVSVCVSPYPKCERSWEHRPEVGQHPDHPTLCARCIANLPEGPGEVRHFV